MKQFIALVLFVIIALLVIFSINPKVVDEPKQEEIVEEVESKEPVEETSKMFSYSGSKEYGGKPLTIYLNDDKYRLNIFELSHNHLIIEVNGKLYPKMNFEDSDRIYLENGVLFILDGICSGEGCYKDEIDFTIQKDLTKTYLDGNVTMMIKNVSFNLKKDNKAEIKDVEVVLVNKWGDIIEKGSIKPKFELSFPSHNSKIIHTEGVEAGASTIRKIEVNDFEHDIYQTSTLKVDFIDINKIVLASAEKTFNIVEDEKYNGDYKLIDVSEFEDYKQINEFIGMKGIIEYNMIEVNDDTYTIEKMGTMYFTDEQDSIPISTCYDFKFSQGEDRCSNLDFFKEKGKYLIIGKWLSSKFEVYDYSLLDDSTSGGSSVIRKIETCIEDNGAEYENVCRCSMERLELCQGIEIEFNQIQDVTISHNILIDDHDAVSRYFKEDWSQGAYYISHEEIKEILQYNWVEKIRANYEGCLWEFCPPEYYCCA